MLREPLNGIDKGSTIPTGSEVHDLRLLPDLAAAIAKTAHCVPIKKDRSAPQNSLTGHLPQHDSIWPNARSMAVVSPDLVTNSGTMHPVDERRHHRSQSFPRIPRWRFGSDSDRPPQQRVTEATRRGYQDERLPIEQLLDSKGFLKGLSPVYRRRKVWEAWKHAHGLNSSPRSEATPFGLDHQATESLETATDIQRLRPLPHGDERAMESAALVDELFDADSSSARTRLLTQIALTFDGIHTASLRRQLVDVIGSHLIGLDDDPTVGYTGRHLTQNERAGAATALRIAHSPHSLYYLEKFTENEGRSYTCHTPQGIGHYRTSATVRRSVVFAVEGMLHDIEHNTYYANRKHTWRMQEYVTDVGRLRNRLAELNSHLYTYAGSPLTRYKTMPLPADASRMPTSIRRLWQQLTAISDHELTTFKALLDRFLHTPGENGKWIEAESSYVERTRRVVSLLLKIGDERWTDFIQVISDSAHLIPSLVSLPELNAKRSLVRQSEPARFNISADGRMLTLWGVNQTRALRSLYRHARTILASDLSSVPDRAERRRAVDAVAAIWDDHRAVRNAYHAYLGELERLESSLSVAAAGVAKVELDRRVRDCGGLEIYYQIISRRTNDPNRILYETALDVLVAVSRSRSDPLDQSIKSQADRYLAGLDCGVLSRGLDLPCVADSQMRAKETEQDRTLREIRETIAARDS